MPESVPKGLFFWAGGALRLQNPAGATISEAQSVAQELPENPAHVPLISVIFLKTHSLILQIRGWKQQRRRQ